MTRVTTTAARKDFEGTLDRARRGESIVLRRGGKDVAALVPISELVMLRRARDLLDALEAVTVERKARAAGEHPVPLAEAKRRLGL